MTDAMGGHLNSGTAATASDVPVGRLDNDSLIIRLHYTVNHLSRWLTPIHDRGLLDRSVYRDQPSIKQLVASLRDEEAVVYPMLHLIAHEVNPNLDRLTPEPRSERQERFDTQASALSTRAEFRRLRHSTLSLLRSSSSTSWTWWWSTSSAGRARSTCRMRAEASSASRRLGSLPCSMPPDLASAVQ